VSAFKRRSGNTPSPHPTTAGEPRAPSNSPDWLDNLYGKLADDDDGRVCEGISEHACRVVPGNFFKTLLANTLTSVGDRLASAKTTIPWLLTHVGAPAWSVSLLVPIRESGSMLPQLWLGALLRQQPVRKHFWAGGSVVQGLSLLAMGWAALRLEGVAAGLTVLLLLTLFSLARSACSVAYKDVLGKAIPKTRRGRLSGWISAVAGLGALVAGIGLGSLPETDSVEIYAALLAGAALLWLAAASIFSRIHEYPGATEGGIGGFKAASAKWTLLRDDAPLRRFVIARALAMGSALAAPFYITLARQDLGPGAAILGSFIVAEGLAGLVSAPIWGRWADRSSRRVFAVACALAACLSLTVAAWSWLSLPTEAARWFYPVVFFGLGVAHAGVRLGRKTYLVDMAEGNQRTDYVAVSNTAIGGLLLLSGLAGALTAWVSVEGTIVLLALAGLAGSALSLRWKEVSEPTP
jgi:hypothetical protein